MKILRNKNVLWVWIVSYLFVLSFPLAASYLVYRSFLAIAVENVENLNSIALSQTASSIDSILNDIQSEGRQILNRQEVISLSFAESPLSVHKIERVGSFQTRLREHTAFSNYLRNIYVHFNNPKIVASTEGMFRQDSFVAHLAGIVNVSDELLYYWLQTESPFQVRMAGASEGSNQASNIFITMSTTAPGRVPEATCIFIADSRVIRDILGYYSWIVSSNEGLIISSPEAEAFAKEAAINFNWNKPEYYKAALAPWDMVVTITELYATDWLIVSAVPMAQYTAEIRILGQVYVIFISVCVLVGVLISVGLAMRNYRLIKNTKVLLAKNDLIKLLRGTLSLYTEQAFVAFCKDYDFNFSTNKFVVICASIRDYDIKNQNEDEGYDNSEETVGKVVGSLLEGLLRKHSDCYYCVYDGYVFFILSQKTYDEPQDAFTQKLSEICANGEVIAKDQHGIEIAVFISNIYSDHGHSMTGIHKAYLEALAGMEQTEGFQISERVTTTAMAIGIKNHTSTDNSLQSGNQLSKDIVKYINENYSNPELNVASIADKFGFSASYLLRIFKRDMYCGVLDYIHKQRVKAAKIMLKESDETVADIAEKIGYANALALIRAFKRLENTTPTAYRNTI